MYTYIILYVCMHMYTKFKLITLHNNNNDDLFTESWFAQERKSLSDNF